MHVYFFRDLSLGKVEFQSHSVRSLQTAAFKGNQETYMISWC